MQVIAGTFDAYAGPYRNTGPFSYGVSVNPMANIYAALNYAKHGRGFGTGPGQIGSGHGYAQGGLVKNFDRGGWLMPGATMALNTSGKAERVGEQKIVLEFKGGPSQYGQFLMGEIQRLVRVNGGGDVQTSFRTKA